MKKKALSLLLVLAMAVSILSAMAISASALDFPKEGSLSGKLTLSADVEATGTLTVSGTASIDLNDHVLSGAEIVVPSGAMLTITDDSNATTPHYFEFVADGAWKLIENPDKAQETVAVTVDKINSNTTVVVVYGGVIYDSQIKNYGTMIINGGNFVGNNNVNDTNLLTTGTLTVNKASFLGNACEQGGAIFNRNGELTIGTADDTDNSDVLIAYNVATKYSGGGILNAASTQDPTVTATFTLNSGVIRNNKSLNENGGGVSNIVSKNSKADAKFVMNGGIIKDNTALGLGGGVYNHVSKNAEGDNSFNQKGGTIENNKGGKLFSSNTYSSKNIFDRLDDSEAGEGLSKLFKTIFNFESIKFFSIGEFLVKLFNITSNDR